MRQALDDLARPIIALTVLAEAGDLRRFRHHRQLLKFCGFDLATHESGQFRGQTTRSSATRVFGARSGSPPRSPSANVTTTSEPSMSATQHSIATMPI
jgi:transposase